MDMLENILNEGKNLEPVIEVNGVKAYDFDDYNKKRKRDALTQKYNGGVGDLDGRVLREDGMGYKSSKVRTVAVSPERYFANRYRKVVSQIPVEKKVKEQVDGEEVTKTVEEFVEKVEYEVTLDYRAVKEQPTGEIYTTAVKTYLIGVGEEKIKHGNNRTTTQKVLKLLRVQSVPAEVFINEFTRKLKIDSAKKIYELVNESGQLEDIEGDNLELDLG